MTRSHTWMMFYTSTIILVNLILLCSGINIPLLVSTNPRLWEIPEDSSTGRVIARAKASDLFPGEKVKWSLEHENGTTQRNGDPTEFLRISKNGVVYLKASVAERKGHEYSIWVIAEVEGRPVARQNCPIKIIGPKESEIDDDAEEIRPPGMVGFPPQTPFPPPNIDLPPTFGNDLRPPIIIPPRPVVITTDTTLNPSANVTNATSTSFSSSTPFSSYNVSNGDSSTEITMAKDPNQSLDPVDTTSLENNSGILTIKQTETPNLLAGDVNKDENENGSSMVLATTIPAVFFFVILPIAAVAYRLLKKRNKTNRRLTKEMRKESAATTNSNMTMSGEGESPSTLTQWVGKRAQSNRYESCDPDNTPPQVVNRWEFPRHHLQINGILGEGCFGQVWRCEALNIDGKEGTSTVAVKTLKESAGERERSDLLSELAVMKMLDAHPNVVRLLGCCTEKDPIFVLMEFVELGKLQSYLRNSRDKHYYGNLHADSTSLSSKDLTAFAHQVARGMEYLASKGIIHRDLAARNILLDKDRICKVADFGFARDVVANHVYERKSDGRLPIRWMAPESLYDNIFTTKTDVWSMGVLMWEIVTLGSTPYPGMAAGEVMRKVRDGYRLDKPEHCRRELYNVMYYCWSHNADSRPTFADYIELDRFPDHDYYNMSSLSGEKL